MTDREQFCTFQLGSLFLGVRVHDVQEVIRYQDLTRVPLAPSTVQGLINLRGQIVTAIDLRKRFRLEERAANVLPMNVVVRTNDGPVSLLVDEIGDVLEVSGDLWEAPPETMNPSTRELVRGIYKLEGKLLLELDAERALDTATAA